jgi:hypothetical protein
MGMLILIAFHLQGLVLGIGRKVVAEVVKVSEALQQCIYRSGN